MRNSKNVMVVDDEEDLRKSLSRLLNKEGYEVYTAGDGDEAVLKLHGMDPIDLVILDVKMPKRNGFEVLLDIRQKNKAGRHIPVIMLTAKAEADDMIGGFIKGADCYLTKPFDPLMLLKVVEYFIGDIPDEKRENLLDQLWQGSGMLYRLSSK